MFQICKTPVALPVFMYLLDLPTALVGHYCRGVIFKQYTVYKCVSVKQITIKHLFEQQYMMQISGQHAG